MNIYIPRVKILEPHDPILIPCRVKGYYKIEAVRPDGSRRLLADWFPNLITNGGLNEIGSDNSWLTGCFVGSGNTAPSNTDTSLVALVGSQNGAMTSTQGAQGSPPYFGTLTTVFRFPAGNATGNLAEVGIGVDATHLFSRALILDGGGSPTTITVLVSEALDVTYQLQNHAPTSDVIGSAVIGGVTYTTTARAALTTGAGNWATLPDIGGVNSVQVFSGAIGAVTSNPSGSVDGADSCVNNAYSNNSLQRDAIVTYGLTRGNVGGILAIQGFLGQLFGGMGSIQVGLNAAIPKDATKVLTLTVRHTWSRFP